MRRHTFARRSSGAYALTLAASLGRGAGSVVTQWLMRNSGAPAGPRLGGQVVGVAGQLRSPAEDVRRLLRQALIGGLVPRRRAAWFSASSTSRWLRSIISLSVGHCSRARPLNT